MTVFFLLGLVEKISSKVQAMGQCFYKDPC